MVVALGDRPKLHYDNHQAIKSAVSVHYRSFHFRILYVAEAALDIIIITYCSLLLLLSLLSPSTLHHTLNTLPFSSSMSLHEGCEKPETQKLG